MQVWILMLVLQTTALLSLGNRKKIWNFIKSQFIFKSKTYFYLHIFVSKGFCLTLSLCSLPLLQKYMCFYSLLNSRQNGVVSLMFIAVHTSESEGFFSKSIWLVVALCTLFFRGIKIMRNLFEMDWILGCFMMYAQIMEACVFYSGMYFCSGKGLQQKYKINSRWELLKITSLRKGDRGQKIKYKWSTNENHIL